MLIKNSVEESLLENDFQNNYQPRDECLFKVKIIFKNKIINRSHMFSGCKNLVYIDLSHFNSANTNEYNVSATETQVENLVEKAFTNSRVVLDGRDGNYGLIMLADAIADTDKLKIMEAAKELKLAFSESNS